MFPTLGHNLSWLALAVAVYAVFATIVAFRQPDAKRRVLLASAHKAHLAVWGLLSAASAVLIYLFLSDDFSVNYVWNNSARSQPIAFKIAAFYGGQSGSLLMWAWMLATFALIIGVRGRRTKLEIAPTTVAIITAVNIFFIGIISTVANPFELRPGPLAPDGFGLNPLLQNYWMQIHPPTLYVGYVGCTVPFAFAIAGLLHRQFDKEWVGIVRRWALFNWIVLGVGIVLGGVWAYETLGWGGYWAWDPVENASLLPWLTLTAFIHSIMIQARRGILRNWNMVLVALTFFLSVFGTTLTRSGWVTSVHSFAESGIGGYFLAFLGLSLLACFGLMAVRRNYLMSEETIDSMLSREGTFLLGNALLVGAAFAVLWGTVYPTVREALYGMKITVEQSYFNSVMAPIGLLLLALAGIGPLLSWRQTSPVTVLRAIRIPLIVTAIAAPMLWVLAQNHTGAATAFILCVFLVAGVVQQLLRFLRAGITTRRQFGGYIVHLGLAIMFVGLTGSSVFKIELEPLELKKGDTMRIGEYTLRFDGLAAPDKLAPEKLSDVAALMTVMRGNQVHKSPFGEPVQLRPNIDVYKAPGASDPTAAQEQPSQQARRPAIMTNPAHDLYLALIGYDTTKNVATIKAYLNPLVMWIWISQAFFIGGSLIAMWPEKRRRKVVEAVSVVSDEAPTTRLTRTPATNPVVAATAQQGRAEH